MPQIVADELNFEGYTVALLVQEGVPATVMADFIHGLNNGTLFEDAPRLCEDCGEPCDRPEPEEAFDEPDTDAYTAALQDVSNSIRPFVKNGLIRVGDLSKVIAQLQEETE